MNDAVQDFRISALERALAALTGGQSSAAPEPQQPVSGSVAKAPVDAQQEARIASLEGAVMALANSVTLLNQQMASLSSEIQKQTNAANMITISPAPTVDAAQDARLNGIDTLVRKLSENVADYNNQMATLIAQYQSMGKRPRAGANGKDVGTA